MPSTFEVPIGSIYKYANFHFGAPGANVLSPEWRAHRRAHKQDSEVAVATQRTLGKIGLVNTQKKLEGAQSSAQKSFDAMDEVFNTNGELKYKEGSTHAEVVERKERLAVFIEVQQNLLPFRSGNQQLDRELISPGI